MRFARVAFAFAFALCPACARVSVDGGFCLTWSDAAPPSAPDPASLSCDVFSRTPDAGPVPPACSDPAWCGSELAYVCVEQQGDACPSPAEARPSFGACVELETKSGPGCDHPISGACTTRSAWSACGPDPSAIGGCCYYVYIVESTYLTEREGAADGRLARASY